MRWFVCFLVLGLVTAIPLAEIEPTCPCTLVKTHKVTVTSTSTIFTTQSGLQYVPTTIATKTAKYTTVTYTTVTKYTTTFMDTNTSVRAAKTITSSVSGVTTISVCPPKTVSPISAPSEFAINAQVVPCTCSSTIISTTTTTRSVLAVTTSYVEPISTTTYRVTETILLPVATSTQVNTQSIYLEVYPTSTETYTKIVHSSTRTTTLKAFHTPRNFMFNLQTTDSPDTTLNNLYIAEGSFSIDVFFPGPYTCVSTVSNLSDASIFHLANNSILRIPSHRSTCSLSLAYTFYNSPDDPYDDEYVGGIDCLDVTNPPFAGGISEMGGCEIDCFGMLNCAVGNFTSWIMEPEPFALCLSLYEPNPDPLHWNDTDLNVRLKVVPYVAV